MSALKTITLSALSRGELEALVERLLAENAALQQAVAKLRAEVAQLEGVKGRPRLKPSGMENATGYGSGYCRAPSFPHGVTIPPAPITPTRREIAAGWQRSMGRQPTRSSKAASPALDLPLARLPLPASTGCRREGWP
jgi:hypothetical protein